MNAISSPPRSDLAPSEQLRVMLAVPGDEISMNHDFARALLAENAGIRKVAADEMHWTANAVRPRPDTGTRRPPRSVRAAMASLTLAVVASTVSVTVIVWLAGRLQ